MATATPNTVAAMDDYANKANEKLIESLEAKYKPTPATVPHKKRAVATGSMYSVATRLPESTLQALASFAR
jgi:hypothetical protein